MTTSRVLLSLGLLSVMSAAAAQTYGPADEGRRFSDGSKVECRNVEVHKLSLIHSWPHPQHHEENAAGAPVPPRLRAHAQEAGGGVVTPRPANRSAGQRMFTLTCDPARNSRRTGPIR